MNKLDLGKWIVVILLIALGIGGNVYFAEQPLYLKLLSGLILVVIAVAIAVQTEKGKKTWFFWGETRSELRRVIWPERKETTQATLVVIGAVFVVAIFLWVLDAFLAKMAAWFVG